MIVCHLCIEINLEMKYDWAVDNDCDKDWNIGTPGSVKFHRTNDTIKYTMQQ